MDQPIYPSRSRSVADLYMDHHVFVWRCLRRLGVPTSEVEDAVQDVFIVVHRRWAGFEGRSSERLWLYGIARRVASDHRRTRHRKDRREEAVALHARAVGPERPDRGADALLLLDQFLDHLPPKQREAFLLFEIEGFSGEEVAKVTRSKLNTAYARRRAARESFIALLGDEESTRHAIGRASRKDRPSKASRRRMASLVVPIVFGTGMAGWARRALASSSARRVPLAASGYGAASQGTLLVGLKAAAVVASLAGVVTAGAYTVAPRSEPAPVEDARVMERAENPARPRRGSTPTRLAAPASVAELEVLTPTVLPEPEVQRPTASAPISRPRPRATRPESEPTKPSPTLKAELELQRRARAALAQGRPLTAMNLIDTYEHEYPDGTFLASMAALRIECLCALDRTKEARTEVRLFVLEHPGHPATRHVRKGCPR